MANITIKDVARIAGVSSASVSRYLNNGYLSEEKREAVKKAIEETGFVPSRQARLLRAGETHSIGVIIPKIDSEGISRIVLGITEVLSEAGYDVLLGNTGVNSDKELEYLNIFSRGNVDGIIYLASWLTPKHKRILKRSSYPVIVIGQKCDEVTCVYHDEEGAAKALTDLILKRGRHDPACIGISEKDQAMGAARIRGFRASVKEHGLTIREENIITCADDSMEEGCQKAKVLFDNDPGIDALYCASDYIAAGAMKVLKERGIRVPDQISVCGMGNTRISRVISPSLTTAQYYYKTSGEEAARLLLEDLKKKTLKKSIQLEYEIIENEST
ncbi:MAG: LacI family DNA-binding transcriptional regulator [Lachnospiraceae bacterium]|jgi:LacI family sucrose operon transcriptional repressor|nr:LacI family DNA-binding transcriptional regulator [Lachnospiraceae bacterium]MEE3460899.1 LacI family DNA-binding transcriptional regulator [Lachnospiraceae bacterium]